MVRHLLLLSYLRKKTQILLFSIILTSIFSLNLVTQGEGKRFPIKKISFHRDGGLFKYD